MGEGGDGRGVMGEGGDGRGVMGRDCTNNHQGPTIIATTLPLCYSSARTESFKQFVAICLKKDPALRPVASVLLKARAVCVCGGGMHV